jgi:hypothetical protein
MPHNEISLLKSEQVNLAARKSDLLEQCIPFRDGLLERLEKFTSEAIAAGLQGVRQCRKKTHTVKILEVAFTVNGFDTVPMATEDVFPIDLETDALAYKMFLYSASDEENAPHVEIIVQGPTDGSYAYKMRWFAQGQPVPIAAGPSVTRQDGHAAADALIDHLYSFKALWTDKPTLGMMRRRKYETHAMGFKALTE